MTPRRRGDGSEHGRVRLEDGGSVEYTLRGPRGAPSLVLLRPLGGTMALWGAFAARLERELRVLAFDPRGVGRSSAPRWPTTTRSMADDARAVMRATGVPRAHLFGLSLGGMVATWLAADAPEAVARLVLASTLVRGRTISAAGVARGLRLAVCLLRPAPAAEAALARRVLSSRFRRENPEAVRRLDAAVRAAPASHANLAALVLAAAMHDATAALPRIEAETLVLAGDRDPLAGPAAAAAVARALLHGRCEVVAGAGHDLTLERPIELAERVAEFVRTGR